MAAVEPSEGERIYACEWVRRLCLRSVRVVKPSRALTVLGLTTATLWAGAGAAVAPAWVGGAARAQEAKLLLSAQYGQRVNATTGGATCTLVSGQQCVAGERWSGDGGFRYVSSVAVDPRTGVLFVADMGNNRVQEIGSDGEFVTVFGRGVKGAIQLRDPNSVSVDPVSGDVYMAEGEAGRVWVDKLAPDGAFLWRIGSGVNKTTGIGICTAHEIELEGVRCQVGSGRPQIENGYALSFMFSGNEIASGGPADLLYVSDRGGVAEFAPSGEFVRDIAIPSVTPTDVLGLAVDGEGNIYVIKYPYELGFVANTIEKLDPEGVPLSEFVVRARQRDATISLHGIAVDSSGAIALMGGEEGEIPDHEGLMLETYTLFGALYSEDGRRISEFALPIGNDGLAAGPDGEVYVAATDGNEILKYVPTPLDDLLSRPLVCADAQEVEDLAVLGCAGLE